MCTLIGLRLIWSKLFVQGMTFILNIVQTMNVMNIYHNEYLSIKNIDKLTVQALSKSINLTLLHLGGLCHWLLSWHIFYKRIAVLIKSSEFLVYSNYLINDLDHYCLNVNIKQVKNWCHVSFIPSHNGWSIYLISLQMGDRISLTLFDVWFSPSEDLDHKYG